MSKLLLKELNCSKYRLLGLVGQGQFGRVYCASHRKTGQLVALKELNKDRFPTHKFLRELRFLLSLQHDNIVNCHAIEHTHTGRCLIMDYCEGGTLRSLMEGDVRLHPAQSLKIVMNVLAGLEHAHSRNIIHCDIKPENILLTLQAEGWTAQISDFGIARLSREITKDGFGNTGSPAYMAPERFYGQHSQASDIYAVGILLFELLAGYRPFSGSPSELMSAHLNQPVKVPDAMSEGLQTVILTALQKLPARRFRSAADMRMAIQAAARNGESNFAQVWSDSRLLHPATPLSLQACHPLRQEPLLAEVCYLIGSSPQLSNPMSNHQSEQIYQLSKRGVGCQHYLAGVLDDEQGVRGAPTVPVFNVDLPDSARQIMVRPQGCFVVTQRSVYLIPSELFQPNAPEQEQSQNLTPQLLAKFSRDFWAAIAPAGQWMAASTLQPDLQSSEVQIWQIPSIQPLRSIIRPESDLFQMLALDARHFITLSHVTHSQTSASGVRIEGFTRRGQSIGCLNLPLPLNQAITTPTSYRLVAIEPGCSKTVLLIDLKPLRISRIGVDIAPVMVATTTWGYAFIAADGEIVLLENYGQRVGRIQGPKNPTAISLPNPHCLLIATWQEDQGHLYTIDLRQVDLDMVF